MLVSLSTLLHGTLYEKLMWTFRVYDLNGDGVITKNEMGNVVVAVYELMGIILKPPVNKHMLKILNIFFPWKGKGCSCNIHQSMYTIMISELVKPP